MIKTAWKKFQSNELYKFIFVGILNTLVGYGTFALFIVTNFHHQIALVASSAIGILHSYVWNKYFTFKRPQRSFKEFIRFVSVYLCLLAVNAFLLWLFVDIYALNAILAQGVILGIVTISSFLGHKLWSFK